MKTVAKRIIDVRVGVRCGFD